MIISYSDKPVVKGEKAIFLAGPTPRSSEIISWRKEALTILKDNNFDGIVYVPEKEIEDRDFDYINQTWWEREALYAADIIVFWIPRDLETMPAFTTNVEFGYWLAKNPEKVIYARPDNSRKNRYLDWLYETETNNKPLSTLQDVLEGAIKKLNG